MVCWSRSWIAKASIVGLRLPSHVERWRSPRIWASSLAGSMSQSPHPVGVMRTLSTVKVPPSPHFSTTVTVSEDHACMPKRMLRSRLRPGSAEAFSATASQLACPQRVPWASAYARTHAGNFSSSRWLSSLCPLLSMSTSVAVFSAMRFVQFEQTSNTLRGINKASSSFTSKSRAEKLQKETSKWITKSTKDYMSEADRDGTSNVAVPAHPTKERLRRKSETQKQRMLSIRDETDRIFEQEMDRMRTDTSKRWKKSYNFFKRHGWAFTCMYLSTYLACLFILYVGFSTGIINKAAAYEYLCIFFGGVIDKERFYQRVEAWDTYIDFGFAFAINEILELIRMPIMILTFYNFRPYLVQLVRRTGNRKSIFRMNAAES